jgi:hypothetical protein
VSNAVFRQVVAPHIEHGYMARMAGASASANPWPAESVAGRGWALGFSIAGLPPAVLLLAKLTALVR